MKRSMACASFLLLSALSPARADFITGYAWVTPTANSDYAAPGTLAQSNCHNGTGPCTHSNYDLMFTTEGLDLDSDRNPTNPLTFGGFLSTSRYPIHNKVYQNGVTDASPIDTVIWEFVGQGRFTGTPQSPQSFTIQHDDGVTFTVHGQVVQNKPDRTSAVVTTGQYTGGAGTWPFQLVYTECCTPPAVLMTSLLGPAADPAGPTPGTPQPATPAPCDLSQANPFPVPFKSNSGLAGVTFTHLTPGTQIRLFSTDGRPVRTLASDDGHDVLWDLNNSAGNAAASGVYFYFLTTTACDQKKDGKVVLIR